MTVSLRVITAPDQILPFLRDYYITKIKKIKKKDLEKWSGNLILQTETNNKYFPQMERRHYKQLQKQFDSLKIRTVRINKSRVFKFFKKKKKRSKL